MRQQTLAMMTGFERYTKKTRRAMFLDEMEQVVPWRELCALIGPVYPKPGNGRPPVGLERMLRIYFLQQWFNLSDPAVEEALYDSAVMRSFARIDLGREPAPDETTVCKFRHLLEEHQLGGEILETVNQYLQQRGVRISSGTIVDATIIHAPSSTKNQEQERDPEMHQTRKGQQWCVSRTRAQTRDAVLKMGERPPGVGLQEQASNRPVLLRPKGVVVSDRGKGIGKRCQVSIEEMSESKPSDDASLLPQDTARTGDDHWLQDKSGRYLFTVPMAVGV